MNLFRFLKSTKGAIKPLNALLISGAAGAVFFYTVNTTTNKQIQAERAIRTLTNIESTAPQQGMHRRSGLLTSINVHDGRNQLATPEERAAMKGNSPLDRYEANQRALGNMDSALGRAAEFSESEGLNTGNRNAVQSADRFIVGNPNANGGGVSVDNSASSGVSSANTGNMATSRRGNRLANAARARASGNSFGGSSGAVSGGISSQGGTRAGAEGPARLSGAMPGGSNIVSQRAEAGLGTNNNTASFGRDRNARMMRGRRSGSDANELKDIVKKSAAAAQNANASANEGGRAFLAGAVNSGGVSVNGGEDMARSASSGDLAAPTNHKLRAIGNKLQQVEDEQEQRKEDQKRLILQLLATVLGSLGMMVAGGFILANLDARIKDLEAGAAGSPVILGMAAALRATRWLIAGAMMAAVTVASVLLFKSAAKFVSNYGASGGVGIGTVSKIIAPILVLGMGYVILRPQDIKGLITNQWNKHVKPLLTKQALTKEGANLAKSEGKKGIMKWLSKIGLSDLFS